MWKCGSCGYKTTSYTTMQRHYYKKHHVPKKGTVSKGKDKKVHIFKPIKR